MANTNLAEAHEKTSGQAYQNDGLRDTDVLTSPSLTNWVETGMKNGVIPITQNRYDESDRNNPDSGNCCVRPNGTLGATSTLYVDAGVVQLDGMFFNVGSGTPIDIAATTNYHSTYHASAIANGINAGDEAVLLVYVDPRLPTRVGLTYGSYVDTGTGLYPSSPSGHLVRQNTVLAYLRIGKGSSGPVILSVEDKRQFIRPGPIALSATEHSDGSKSGMRNDFVGGFTAANLPITNMGLVYARDPADGSYTHLQGAGQTHLFFQSDQVLGRGGAGGEYQITPTHRTAQTGAIPYAPGAPVILPIGTASPLGLQFEPLTSEEDATIGLIDVFVYDATNAFLGRTDGALAQWVYAPGVSLTLNDPATLPSAYATAAKVIIKYVHAGHV